VACFHEPFDERAPDVRRLKCKARVGFQVVGWGSGVFLGRSPTGGDGCIGLRVWSEVGCRGVFGGLVGRGDRVEVLIRGRFVASWAFVKGVDGGFVEEVG